MIRLHQKYIFNKLNSRIICSIMLISIFFQFVIVFSFEDSNLLTFTKIETLDYYVHSSITFTKMMMILWSIYLFGFSFSKYGDNYRVLIITKTNQKIYFISKVMVLIMEILKCILFLFFIHFWIGSFFTKWYVLKLNVFIEYVNIFLLSCIYGLISLIIVCLFKSIYSIFLSTSVYLLSEMLASGDINQKMIGMIQLFFPTEWNMGGKDQLYFGHLHIFLLCMLYIMLSDLIYCCKKD